MSQKQKFIDGKGKSSVVYWLLTLLSVICITGIGFLVFQFSNSPKEISKKTTELTVITEATSEGVNENSTLQESIFEEKVETTESSSMVTGVSAELQLNDQELKVNGNQVYYGVYYFNNSDYFSSNNSEPTPSASVIKVFIMEYIYMKASMNELSLDEVIEGAKIEALVTSMIQQSDNTATNRLIDYIGIPTLNNFFLQQGYKDTKLERRMLDNEARKQGLENYTSIDDTMLFLKKLYEQRETVPFSTMVDIMKGQMIRTKIPSQLTETIIANKTGELESVENDIGLVFSEKAPFAIVVLTDNVVNTQGMRDAIGRFALEAYEQGEREDKSGLVE